MNALKYGLTRVLKPFVSGSFKKVSKQSMKVVPLNGSPPIPEKIQRKSVTIQNALLLSMLLF